MLHDIFRIGPGMMTVKSNPNATKWSLENGYKTVTNGKDYPLRVYDSGHGAALEISLDIFERDFELFCHNGHQGFSVFLNVPGDGDSIEFRETGLEIPPSMETVITLSPKSTTTSAKLRKYDPSHKKCFFDSERKLRFYKTYSQKKCFEECKANYTKMMCGCAEFYQPSK